MTVLQGGHAPPFTYAYDGVGNCKTGPDTTAYIYVAANTLVSDTSRRYDYDKNGNLIKKTEQDDDGKTVVSSYTYDYENRLIKATVQKGTDTTTVTFKYDPFGRRIEKKVTETSSPSTGEDTGGGETKTYTFVYDREDVIAEYLTRTEDGHLKTTATHYIHGPGVDEPLAIEQKGEVYYYHADGLGSIAAITDAKQKTVESYTYYSFGTFKRKGDRVKNTFTFTGREWDKEINLYYYRARYYDTKVGRFISRDPIGFWGGVNVYNYVGGNPVNLVDPWGLYLGQMPPPPPGFNFDTWQVGRWPNGKWFLKDPDGNIYTAHAEDRGHWRHWDVRDPNNNDKGQQPPNSGKPYKKNSKSSQCPMDPNGDAPGWVPPETKMGTTEDPNGYGINPVQIYFLPVPYIPATALPAEPILELVPLFVP